MSLNIPKGILKSKTERFIVALTILFVGTIIAFYAWGIDTMATTFDAVVSAMPPETPVPMFKLDQAQAIDLRGQTVP